MSASRTSCAKAMIGRSWKSERGSDRTVKLLRSMGGRSDFGGIKIGENPLKLRWVGKICVTFCRVLHVMLVRGEQYCWEIRSSTSGP